jgi:hypothetical protein
VRIRQVKPSFWTDPTLAHISVGARLMYVGLWCVADDAGWLTWDLDELGALLFPYENPGRRRRQVETWAAELTDQARVKVKVCGCAVVPTLETHQKTSGGSRSYATRQKHERLHRGTEESGLVQTKAAGTERNGKVGNGSARGATDQDHDEETTSEFQARVPRPVVAVAR